ncbi:1-acyl-sn-glycerol-3-phosphate acyltransferase [Geothermobacter ehrlichii]|uniref:1-acyl-sn-glycerol-3-phosphate acyltransferase n=1 Tax=Geothermobacter ehrlichii TaxID=213224 RepID=A0A5D3WI30_9BACT|nr:lysophospholipid acyltransferase family protein [Geothermobacter ehrlichii]TYO97510.1 1-acyl-sn-glycerol-3-phosphate acyltransferase [Geothermobacter ehrlichii]
MRSLFFYSIFLPLTLAMILVGFFIALVGGANPLHNWARLWGRIGLALAGVRLRIKGLENIPADRPVIFMANHQSNFDILALLAGIPGQFRWLAKAELFRIPLFGLVMRQAGYIPVERGDRRESLESMKMVASRITAGASVIIFPEGTRTEDGSLRPFKKGGFLVALQSGVEIVPVAISGSFTIMPKGGKKIRGGRIEVTFFAPVPTAGKSVRQLRELMAQIRQPIAATLGDGEA